jgi:hypothetical protein
MRRSFKREVRDYVIVERYKMRPWKDIVADVREKFGIEPPTVRIMQRWFSEYKGATADPTGVKSVARVIEDAANEAKPLAQAKMMGEVFPVWSFLQGPPHYLSSYEAGLVAMWKFYEIQIGRDYLDRTYEVYRQVRDEIPESAFKGPPPGWTYKVRKQEDTEK